MTTPSSTNGVENNNYSIPLLLALIAAGLAGNYFRFPIFLNIDFLFGSIFAMLALQFLGLGRGILAAAIIAGSTYFIWNHPYAIIIMTAEVAVVGALMGRRKMGMVLADTLYWLIIGMPLVYLSYHVAMEVPFSTTFITMIKQSVNGIANALVARLIFTGYALRSRSSLTSYREIVYNLLAFFVLCPALILLAVGSRTDFAETDLHIRTSLMNVSRLVDNRLETWVMNRKSAIVSLAEMSASRSPQQMQSCLEQANKSDSNFLRVGLLDREATTTAFYPLLDELGQRNIGKNFADRPYIPRLKQTLKPMLSEVVMGRVGIPKPLVSMLAPVVIRGAYGGYVIGVLSLQQLQDYLDKSSYQNATFYTLLDKNGNVIMTNRPDQKVMTPFVRGKGTLHPLGKGISQWVPTLPPNTPVSERWKKSFYVAESTVGDLAEWEMILEQPVAPFQKALYDNYTGKLTVLFLILLVALALAELFSRNIVVTLDKLCTLTHELPVRLATDGKEIPWPESGIKESNYLINNFMKMADSLTAQFSEVRQVNESLEQRVEERTDQLAKIMHELNIILENAPVGITKIIDRKLVWVNQKTEELFLYAKEEMAFQPNRKLYPSDEAYEKLVQEAYPVLAQGLGFETVQDLIRKDGVHLLVRCIGKAIDPQDMSKGTIWLLEDITARKGAEEALKESEQRYRTVADFTSGWEYWIMPDGTLRYMSPSCEQISGYSPDEFYADPQLLTRIIHPDDMHLYDGHRHSLSAQEAVEPLDYRIRTKDGGCRWVSHVCRRVYDTAGQPLGERASNSDITDRKRAEEEIKRLNADLIERAAELEAANMELEAFNYTVAHDLRQPLNLLSSYCQVIDKVFGDRLEEECLGYIRKAYSCTLQMNRLIEALLNFSRMGQVEPSRESVDLSMLAQEVSLSLKIIEPERQVDFRIPDGIVANGDANLLRAVLNNLFGNALKYTGMREKAVIEFGVRDIDGVPTYFVRDNGVGFDMTDADKLFAPFQRLTGAEKYRGFGIGLATVERIIRRHGGKVWAEGEPDKGATFYFTLGST